jgi:uncharacterized membrane protein YkvI
MRDRDAEQSQVAGLSIRGQIISTVILVTSMYALSTVFDGVVVARLPFAPPFSFISGLTHRGLPGEDYREAS